MPRRLLAALGVAALASAAFTPALSIQPSPTAASSTAATAVALGPTTDPEAPEEHVQEDFVLESFDGTQIHYTLFRPAGADAANPVPLVFSSHGWGGSRTDDMTMWLDAGFGGLSFDQRGFGQSGGLANVQDPELEAQDVKGLLDVVQGLGWVQRDHDAAASVFGPDDPTVFAVGGSYGGGYQTIAALTETAESGDTRFDALSPEITWYDLPQSLAPQKVARSVWTSLLTGIATQDVPQFILEAYAYGAATGQWPDGTVPGVPNLDEIFHAHSPAGFVEGGTFVEDGDVRLDVPALWHQGSSDTLFNLNEGIDNLDAMTDEAREGSFLIGYNGGHVLPTALPMGAAGDGDPCSAETVLGGWDELRIAFFAAVAAGESTQGFLDHRYGIADMDGTCVWTDDVRSTTPFDVGVDIEVTSGTATTTGPGAPQYLPVFTAAEQTVVTGVPTLDATWYSAGADQRVFFGLARGSNEVEARQNLMQHQMQPHLELLASAGHEVTVELGAGGMTLAPGETLYLVVSPFVELYAGHGSNRTPGVVALEDMTLNVPLQPTGCDVPPEDTEQPPGQTTIVICEEVVAEPAA